MSDGHTKDVFVERILNVSHANGVFRVTLGVSEDANNVRDSIRLMVPANQLGPILQGIANAAKNIGEQIQFKADDDDGKATTSPKKAAAPKKAAPKKRSTSK
jgi:hypothetical protein